MRVPRRPGGTATHFDGYRNGLYHFVSAGPMAYCRAQMEGDAVLAPDCDGDRKRHQFLGLAVESAVTGG
jgi:hypothetical protein